MKKIPYEATCHPLVHHHPARQTMEGTDQRTPDRTGFSIFLHKFDHGSKMVDLYCHTEILGLPKFGSVRFSKVFSRTANQNRTAGGQQAKPRTEPAEPPGSGSNLVRTELNLQFLSVL